MQTNPIYILKMANAHVTGLTRTRGVRRMKIDAVTGTGAQSVAPGATNAPNAIENDKQSLKLKSAATYVSLTYSLKVFHP